MVVSLLSVKLFVFQYSLGILNKSEQTTEGIIDIMEEQHKLVPVLCNGLVRLLTCGDLMTLEREINAQIDKEDSFTAAQRLEGLIPILADFHTYGNFLEVSPSNRISSFNRSSFSKINLRNCTEKIDGRETPTLIKNSWK